MGFFHEIQSQFGAQVMFHLKEYAHNEKKLANLKNRRILLVRCRKDQISPKFLENQMKKINNIFEYKDSHTGQLSRDFSREIEGKILNFQIKITIRNLQYLEKRQHSLEKSLSTTLPEHTFLEFKTRIRVKFNRNFHKLRTKNVSKFEKWKEDQKITIPTSKKWFRNLSDVTPPPEVITFLKLGPKFSLKPSIEDIDIPRLLATIEFNNLGTTDKEKNIIRAKATNIVTNFINKTRTNKQVDIFHKLEKATKNFFREHTELLVTQSDKGGVTVMMPKNTYIDMSLGLLQDSECYQELKVDPTNTIEQKANRIVTELKNNGYISQTLASKLMTYDGICPKFYGLPKIHKDPLALRPIVSSIESPVKRLSEFIRDILKASYDTENAYYIRDSFDFAQRVNNLYIPENYQIVSLDAISLYTNITLDMTLESIEQNWIKIEQHCDIPIQIFKKVVSFIFESTYFTFNKKFFKQKQGTPMGSVLSPIISQYVMDSLLDRCIPRLPFEIPFCYKFVDDLILAIPKGSDNTVLAIFNNYCPKIQFTIETESNNGVPFLDTKLIREGTLLKTDWYKKSLASGRYIHERSYHPYKMKLNLILNMKTRITKISNHSFLNRNLKILEENLIENGYNVSLVRKVLYKTPNSTNLTTEDTQSPRKNQTNMETESSKKNILVLPFIEGLTSQLRKLLKSEETLFANKLQKTARSVYTRITDNTPMMRNPSVVYKIPCSECDLNYIGETGRTLIKRITSHKSDCKRNVQSCALAKHVIQTKHNPDYGNISILDREKNLYMRKFIEMFRITQESETSMNSKKDIEKLSIVYADLVETDLKLKKRKQREKGEMENENTNHKNQQEPPDQE